MTDASIPRRYWSDLKSKLKNEGSEVYEKIVQLKMIAPDGKKRETDSFSTEDLLRVIQSIPSYNVDYIGMVNSKKWEGLENDKMSDSAFQEFLENAFKNIFENSKGEFALYICHADRTHNQLRKK